ncbi:hypothetical protein HOK31_10035, partial [Candidatus Poribacteria bacterium]|nr:hypothetical protein [Candidatus Poribacteria bacterium]
MNESKQEVEAQGVEPTSEDTGTGAAAPGGATSDDETKPEAKKSSGPLVLSVPFPMSTGAIRGAALLAVVGGLSSASFGFTQLRPVYVPTPPLPALAPDRSGFDALLSPGSSASSIQGSTSIDALAPLPVPPVGAAPVSQAMPQPAPEPQPSVVDATPTPADPTPAPPAVAKAPTPKPPVGLDSSDPAARKKAVRKLRRGGAIDGATTTALLAMLDDSDASVRESVVTALASAPAKPPVTAGLVAAARDKSESVRVRAISALSTAPASDEVVTALTNALKDRSTPVRNGAILALGKHGSRARTAAPALVAVLKSNGNAYTRSFASTALGQVASPTEAVVSALVQ